MPIFVAAVLLALGGCASVQPRPAAATDGVDVPAAWSAAEPGAAAGTSASAQWWSRFDDPLLGRLVDQALQASTSVRGAQDALRQARALRDVAAAAVLPAAGGSASAQRSTGGMGAGNNFRAGLDASWEIDLFGANQSALDTSEATARASAATLGSVRVSIAAEVALDYIALRGAQARLAIASDNLASQQETLQLTQWRAQAGLVSSLEAEQARAAVEQTQAQLPSLQTSIVQSTHALAVLAGQPPAALSTLLAAARPIPQAGAELAMSFPAETLRQRPDVRAAEHQVRAAAARVAQADAARRPSFKLSGSLGLNALTLGALTHGASVVSAVLAGGSVPVYDAGAARAQVRAQQAALDQARVTYQASVLTALKDVEDALAALRGDRERLLRLRRAADAATNAASLARQRYRSGLVDFQTVLDTQRILLATQDSVAGASTDVSADHVRLYKALGGGWRADADDGPPGASDDAHRSPRS